MRNHPCSFYLVEYYGGGNNAHLSNYLQTLLGKWISTTWKQIMGTLRRNSSDSSLQAELRFSLSSLASKDTKLPEQ